VAPVTRRAVRVRLAPAHADLGVPHVVVDPAKSDATLTRLDAVRAILVEGDERRRVLLLAEAPDRLPSAGADVREVVVDGWRILVEVEPEARAALRERATRSRTGAGVGGPTEVRAVIPGRILSVAVGEGDAVVAGQPLLVVEAMKMQNDLRAPRAGTVRRVAVAAGQTIELGDVLVVLE
jgi:biotin carboxyl carrier protein